MRMCLVIGFNFANPSYLMISHDSKLSLCCFLIFLQGAGSIISSVMNPNAQFRGTTTDIVNNSYFVTGSQAVLNMIESMHTR